MCIFLGVYYIGLAPYEPQPYPRILDFFRFQVKALYLSINNRNNLSKVNNHVGWIISPQPVGDFKRLVDAVIVNKVANLCYQRTRWKTPFLLG